jgi:hypothetical protein
MQPPEDNWFYLATAIAAGVCMGVFFAVVAMIGYLRWLIS